MGPLADALKRVESVLLRRPEFGISEDKPATARWNGGTRVTTRHANGTQVETDMPSEIGGTGDRVTPGWLFRAGLASCATTSIVLVAATEGVAIDTLEITAGSHSDARGLLGMTEADGTIVSAGPTEVRLQIRIGARGVAPERLRVLVETAIGRSPIPCAVREMVPMPVQIEIVD